MRASVTIKKDRKKWDSLKKNLLANKNEVVDVGWWGGSVHPRTKMSMAQVAQWNEEGHYNGGMFEGTYSPPRPFMRIALLKWVNRMISSQYTQQLKMIAEGSMSWQALYNIMEEDLKELVRESIKGFSSPANTRTTIELKGRASPLIETGTMMNTIKTRIRSKHSG